MTVVIGLLVIDLTALTVCCPHPGFLPSIITRSEEHTSELQSQSNLVCRLLLEKKKTTISHFHQHPIQKPRYSIACQAKDGFQRHQRYTHQMKTYHHVTAP